MPRLTPEADCPGASPAAPKLGLRRATRAYLKRQRESDGHETELLPTARWSGHKRRKISLYDSKQDDTTREAAHHGRQQGTSVASCARTVRLLPAISPRDLLIPSGSGQPSLSGTDVPPQEGESQITEGIGKNENQLLVPHHDIQTGQVLQEHYAKGVHHKDDEENRSGVGKGLDLASFGLADPRKDPRTSLTTTSQRCNTSANNSPATFVTCRAEPFTPRAIAHTPLGSQSVPASLNSPYRKCSSRDTPSLILGGPSPLKALDLNARPRRSAKSVQKWVAHASSVTELDKLRKELELSRAHATRLQTALEALETSSTAHRATLTEQLNTIHALRTELNSEIARREEAETELKIVKWQLGVLKRGSEAESEPEFRSVRLKSVVDP